jgi:hypothetical protein
VNGDDRRAGAIDGVGQLIGESGERRAFGGHGDIPMKSDLFDARTVASPGAGRYPPFGWEAPSVR